LLVEGSIEKSHLRQVSGLEQKRFYVAWLCGPPASGVLNTVLTLKVVYASQEPSAIPLLLYICSYMFQHVLHIIH
jgi:hypothetical protein